VPFFTLQFQALTGPRCDLYLAVSVPRENALKAAGLPIPAPILVKGLVDTGASVSGVDPETIEKFGLVATGIEESHSTMNLLIDARKLRYNRFWRLKSSES
jgi:hypothetical protein